MTTPSTPRLDRLEKNYILNGSMEFDQEKEGGAYTSHAAYCLDQWLTSISGGGSVQRIVDTSIRSRYSARVISTSAGTCGIFQRIEAIFAQDLAGKECTLSFLAKLNSGSLTSFGVRGYTCDSRNNFSGGSVLLSQTQPKRVSDNVQITNLTSSWVRYYVSITMPEAAKNGLFLTIGNAGATDIANFELAEVMLCIGKSKEFARDRSYPEELSILQRYFTKSYNQGVAAGTITPVGKVATRSVTIDTYGVPSVRENFPVPMAYTPTITCYSPNTGAAGKFYITSPAGDVTGNPTVDVSTSGFNCYVTSNIINMGGLLEAHYIAVARL